MNSLTQAVGQLIIAVLIGLVVLFVLSLFFSVPIWLLWNGCLVGAVDGVHEVTWLQAWGLGWLCGLLFKNNSSTNKQD